MTQFEGATFSPVLRQREASAILVFKIPADLNIEIHSLELSHGKWGV